MKLVLAVLREERGWSRAELARRAKMNASTISLIEGKRFRPYDSQLARLTGALEYAGDPAELLEEVG